jgi:hypothetical protein
MCKILRSLCISQSPLCGQRRCRFAGARCWRDTAETLSALSAESIARNSPQRVENSITRAARCSNRWRPFAATTVRSTLSLRKLKNRSGRRERSRRPRFVRHPSGLFGQPKRPLPHDARSTDRCPTRLRKCIGITNIRRRFNAADIRIDIAFRLLPRRIRIETWGVTSIGSRRGPFPWRIDPRVLDHAIRPRRSRWWRWRRGRGRRSRSVVDGDRHHRALAVAAQTNGAHLKCGRSHHRRRPAQHAVRAQDQSDRWKAGGGAQLEVIRPGADGGRGSPRAWGHCWIAE